MKDARNIDNFSRALAVILGELYREFPMPHKVNVDRLQAMEDASTAVRDDIQAERAGLYDATLHFLVNEGFVRTDGTIIEYTLTLKGLAAVNRKPDLSLDDLLRDRP